MQQHVNTVLGAERLLEHQHRGAAGLLGVDLVGQLPDERHRLVPQFGAYLRDPLHDQSTVGRVQDLGRRYRCLVLRRRNDGLDAHLDAPREDYFRRRY